MAERDARANRPGDDDDLHQRCAAWIDADPAVVDDPYPLWADLRQQCPVIQEPGHGVWLISRFDDCQAIARDSATWSSVLAAKGAIRGEDIPAVREMRSHLRAVARGEETTEDTGDLIDAALRDQVDRLQHNDPPSYNEYRTLVSRWFTPGRVAALEPRVRQVTRDLIDAFPDDGQLEFLTAFAGPLPGTIIADLLDVPAEYRTDFIEWDNVVAGNTPLFEAQDDEGTARLERIGRVHEWLELAVAERRNRPGSDLVSLLVTSRLGNGDSLRDAHARQIAFTFHVGGQETTSKLLTSSMRLLAGNPELQATLRADPALIPAFVEEALRIQSPTQGLFRVARADTEVNGVRYRAGSLVQLLWGSANRDEAIFENPDVIDLGRANLRSHLAFGHGVHLCPGNHLARLEGTVAVEELLAATSSIELDPTNTYEYMTSHVMRGLRRLDLIVDPVRG
ncbi:MAG: cytochrome P450 [Acidimicrobiales bacterium]